MAAFFKESDKDLLGAQPDAKDGGKTKDTKKEKEMKSNVMHTELVEESEDN